MRTLFTALLGLTFSLTASATDFYRVEVVLIGFFDENSASHEQWPVTLEEPDDGSRFEEDALLGTEDILLTDSDADKLTGETPEEITPEEVLIKPAAGLDFQSASQRINYRQDMKVLWHQAWLEKIQDEDNAIEHTVEATNEKNGIMTEVSGSIRLHKSRFLHITPDLNLQQFVQGYADDPDNPYSAERQWLPVRAAHINRSRRMRSNEIHYLDHPLLGILIQVTPVEDEEAPAETATDTSGQPE